MKIEISTDEKTIKVLDATPIDDIIEFCERFNLSLSEWVIIPTPTVYYPYYPPTYPYIDYNDNITVQYGVN